MNYLYVQDHIWVSALEAAEIFKSLIWSTGRMKKGQPPQLGARTKCISLEYR